MKPFNSRVLFVVLALVGVSCGSVGNGDRVLGEGSAEQRIVELERVQMDMSTVCYEELAFVAWDPEPRVRDRIDMVRVPDLDAQCEGIR